MSEHGALKIGEDIDEAGSRNGTSVAIEPSHLTTHGVILGMTGSGKTGLGIVLLEEALSRGIPALIIDPKGDMGNLLLNFPALRAEDFRPWIDEAEAKRAGASVDDHAARTAEKWAKGLASWELGGDQMRRLGMTASFTIFTPGSTAGVPINVLGSVSGATSGSSATSAEDEADAVESFVSGLLALINRTSDPLSSPDHILLSNLVARLRAGGQAVSLETLVAQVANPPIRKLGVFELDTFMPPKDRMALAVQLNSLLASPSFAAWQTGVPLDMQRLLWDDAGKPRAAIMYLAHLAEPERQFVVTLLMSSMVSWMRRQPGTSELRALIYMDEVAGFAPPTAQPPSKKPMLTILKQARAHGVGMVLSTQNPVDLDYKAMSNAGTWLVGRLQTERDKARVLEGMKSAAGDVDLSSLDALIGGLGPRQFILHTARGGAPRRFTTRWAMSYLRGPLTRHEVERLRPDETALATEPHAPEAHASAASTESHGAATQSGHDDATPVQPKTASGVRVRFLDPGAPWAGEIGATPGARRHEAAVAARVHMRFDDKAAGLDMVETYECVWHPLTEPLRPEDAHVVDYDERDLRTDAPAHVTYVLPDAPIDRSAYFKDIERQLRTYLMRERSAEVLMNRELKLFSRAGESRDDFIARCRHAASERADADAAKLQGKYATKRDRLEKQQRAAEDRVRELNVDARQRFQQEIVAGAGQLLSVFLGGRGSARSLAGAATRRGTTRRTQERLDTAQGKLNAVVEEMEQIDEELAEEMSQITEQWDAVAERIEAKNIPLQQSDVTIEEVVLLWVPVES